MSFTAFQRSPFTPNLAVYDPNPQTGLTYTWTQVSGPDNAIFSNTSVLNPTITCNSAGAYFLKLTASDAFNTVSQTFEYDVQPIFNSSQSFTAYCALGAGGTPATYTASFSSNTSQADADSKAVNAAQTAANAALQCTTFLALPRIKINYWGWWQVIPNLTSIRISYLSQGTPSAPLQETVIATINNLHTGAQPLDVFGTTIADPFNLILPYATPTITNIDGLVSNLSSAGLYLIVRGDKNNAGLYDQSLPLNLDSTNDPAVQITSLSAGSGILSATESVISLTNASTNVIHVSLDSGTFIGVDTNGWKSSVSIATTILVYQVQGPVNSPAGLAFIRAFTPVSPSIPSLASVLDVTPFLTSGQLSNPLNLVFYAATYDSGAGIYTPIANSIQFNTGSVYSMSNSLGDSPAALAAAPANFTLNSLIPNLSLNIVSATNGVLSIPDPTVLRIVLTNYNH